MKHLKLFEDNSMSKKDRMMLATAKNAYANCNKELIQYIKDKGFNIEIYENEIVEYLFKNLYLDGLILFDNKFEELVRYVKDTFFNLNIYKAPYSDDLYFGKDRTHIYMEYTYRYSPPKLLISVGADRPIVKILGYDNWRDDIFKPFIVNLLKKEYNMDIVGSISMIRMNDYELWDGFKQINESLHNIENKFYIYQGNLILIEDVILWGNDEYQIKYIDNTGKTDTIIIGIKDIEEDFIKTDQTFNPYPYPYSIDNVIQKKEIVLPIKKSPNRYNLVYYIGNKKVETIKYNLNNQQANGLRSHYRKKQQYQLGEIRKELVL